MLSGIHGCEVMWSLEVCNQSMEWPLQMLTAPQGTEGHSPGQAKKKLYLPGTSGGRGFVRYQQRDAARSRIIPEQENLHVWRGRVWMEEVSSGLSGTWLKQRALQFQAAAVAPGDVLQLRKKLAGRRCRGAEQQPCSSRWKQEYWALKSQPCCLVGFQIFIWENASNPDVKWAGKVQASRFNNPLSFHSFFFFFWSYQGTLSSQILPKEALWE